MKNHYCLDVSFPKVNLDTYMTTAKKIKKTHHAHLFVDGLAMEMRIYFDSKTYLGHKLAHWLSEVNWRKFGTFILVKNEKQNPRLLKIDLSNSSLTRVANSTAQISGNLQYVKLYFDTVKFYWQPVQDFTNTAEFYLNKSGLAVVSEYYSVLFGTENKFEFSRMNGMSDFYLLKEASFRPEFNFVPKDGRKKSESTIIKEPKIQFNYEKPISEQQAVRYSEIVRLLISFYFHVPVDYTLSRIHLKNKTVTIKRRQQKNLRNTTGHLWAFGNTWNFDKFMKANWQTGALKNYKKLSKVIELFLQSLVIDGGSRFLILYNIIEVSMGGAKQKEKTFASTVTEKERKKKYNEALEVVLQTIKPNDHKDFKQKWIHIPSKMKYKPMKSPLISFLEKQKLRPSEFPISVSQLKKIRDEITHGSINNVTPDELERANILMHRISGILILNLLGINEWNLNTTLK